MRPGHLQPEPAGLGFASRDAGLAGVQVTVHRPDHNALVGAVILPLP